LRWFIFSGVFVVVFLHLNGAIRILTLATVWNLALGSEPPLDLASWEARGAAALQPFKMNLKAALTEGLAIGEEAAIRACRLQAPELAAQASSSEVRVGRTSHKLRNRGNAPRRWMQAMLDVYLAAPDASTARVVRLESGGVGYVEPIHMQTLCLACHGEAVAPAVAARIEELYPEDQATGFSAGEFRGLFWAEFPAQE
jgi:hypothetical protein